MHPILSRLSGAAMPTAFGNTPASRQIDLTLDLREAGLAIETPLLVEENSASHQHILAFATLVRESQGSQAPKSLIELLDSVIETGKNREAFFGALALIKAEILPETTSGPAANTQNGHWAHHLARFGHEPLDNALVAPSRGTITLAERFEALRDAGMAFDDVHAVAPPPLSLAVQHGNSQTLSALIGLGANVDATTGPGLTPLHIAAQSGHTETINTLVKAGAKLDATNAGCATPLHSAAQAGQISAITALILSGAKVNLIDRRGRAPLHVAAKAGHADAITTLIDLGADVNVASQYGGYTPLHSAAQAGHSDAITVLVLRGANVNYISRSGHTPLQTAAQAGHTNAIITLVKKGGRVLANDQAAINTILDALQQALNPPQKRQRVDGPN
ncbi:MAG: hypothetical protein RIR70_111 [Pseudomonadota bacterium]|jgi:hypothetical protein